MHELSMMQSVFEIVRDEMEKHGLERIDLIKLKVGELTHIEESSMQFAFGVLKEDTPLVDAQLELEYVPAEAYCRECDLRYPMERYRVICPECGTGGEIVAGKELYVDSLEVENDERG